MSPIRPLRGAGASVENAAKRRQEQQNVLAGHTDFEVTK